MNGRPERIGPYEVVGLLGDGGMGRVYRARDPRFDRMVAVKVLQPHLASSPELARRFTAEAVIQAKLRHPNIVAVHDFVADGETLAIVMEFIDGRSLEKVISDAGGPLTPERCVALMSQVLSAMAYAHEQGLVHRDVKPSNIVVETIRGEEHAKVVDFGIAKILGDDKLRTATGAKMGTLAYMSPEQVKSPKNVDARSDIYSLGVVLYEMLTGRTPFDADSEYELMDRIVREEPPVPSRVIEEIPSGLDAVVRRAMAKRPEDRYPDCDAFRRDLQQAIDGAVASPRPVAPVQHRQATPPRTSATWSSGTPVTVRDNPSAPLRSGPVMTFSGVLMVAGGLLLLASLISYHSGDNSLFSSTASARTKNLTGWIGASLAEFAFQFFGFAALLLPVAILGLGVGRCRSRPVREPFWKLLCFVAIVGSLAPLLHIAVGRPVSFGGGLSAGGFVGEWVGSALTTVFSTLGASILLEASLLFTTASLLRVGIIGGLRSAPPRRPM